MLPLQQLHYGCLRGRYNNDASIFTATNESSVGWYVHTCGHLKRFITTGNDTQLIYNSGRTRIQFIKCLLQTNRSSHFQLCGGFVWYKRKTFKHFRKNIKHIKINVLTDDSVIYQRITVINYNSKKKMTYVHYEFAIQWLVFRLLNLKN